MSVRCCGGGQGGPLAQFMPVVGLGGASGGAADQGLVVRLISPYR